MLLLLRVYNAVPTIDNNNGPFFFLFVLVIYLFLFFVLVII